MNRISSAKVDIIGRHVPERFVIAPAVVVFDERPDLPLELLRTLPYQQIDPLLAGTVVAFDLPVRLRVIGRGQNVAPATVNRDLTALKRMFGWAAEIGLTKRHLLHGVRPFKEATRERRLLSLDEYNHLINTCSRVKKTDTFLLTLFVVIIGETGCRKAEALGLRRVDCDCQVETITLNRVKGYRARIVPMSPRLRMMLEVLPEGGEFVLTNGATGKPLVDPKKGFACAAKLTGVPWLQIYDMRRFRACQWAIGGVPVPTIQKLLGHQSLETTLRYLKHLDPDFDQVRRASEAEMEFLSGRQLGDTPGIGGQKREWNRRNLLN